jgi:hypothetical protein
MKHIALAEYKEHYSDWHYFRFTGYTYRQMMEAQDWLDTMLLQGNWRIVGWSDGCAMRYGAIVKTRTDAMMTKIAWNGRGMQYAGDILDEIDEDDYWDFLEGEDDYDDEEDE